MTPEALAELLRVDADAWNAELPQVEAFMAKFGARLPERMAAQVARVRQRLQTPVCC